MEDEFDGLDLAGQVALLRAIVAGQTVAISWLGHALRRTHEGELNEAKDLLRRFAIGVADRAGAEKAEPFRRACELLENATAETVELPSIQ